MLRKTTCAAGGVALACAAAYSLSVLAKPGPSASFDLSWLYERTAAKSDRLPIARSADRNTLVVAFDLPAESTTIAARSPVPPRLESAVRISRKVRTIPINPVREVPNEEEITKKSLPVGCEPAFSPVTMPAYAHISARCDS